jgi:DNA-binding Lrp family transcriptional regulator
MTEKIYEIDNIPEIVEAHYTTGEYIIFAKVKCKKTGADPLKL